MQISLADLSPLSVGAAILGTGGGGDPYVGQLALRYLIEQTSPPVIIDVDSLADDALVISVGMSGSPSVILEKLVHRSFADAALRRCEKILGRRADAVVPVEIGGINSLIPLMTACETGLPLVDGDGMGRAFPTLERTSFAIAGIAATPVVTINERLETTIIEGASHERCERIARASLVAMGASGACAFYPMTGREAKNTVVRGTMSLALEIGRSVYAARSAKTDPFEAILRTAANACPPNYGRILIEGKIADVSRDTIGGYNVGSGSLVSNDGDRQACFSFQNEFLYIRSGDDLLAAVPDLICFLDSETAEAVTCETLRYGQRVSVLGFAAPHHFRTPAGLAATGPASFGIDEIYIPLERLPPLAGVRQFAGFEAKGDA